MTVVAHLQPGAERQLDQVSCAAVLWAISVETSRVAGLCDRLENLVSHLMEKGLGDERAVILQEAQMIDTLQQQVSALASFAETAARDACEDARVDIGPALASVPMTALARRLEALLQKGEEPDLTEVASGDLDLF